jgi:uncharacterized protein YjeT (DUF2065 family)
MLNFALVGLSLVFQPRAWARYFLWMRREGEAGMVIHGLFCVLWGSLIVAFHPDWNGLLVILPAFGVLQLLEGLVFLVFPTIGMRIMTMLSEERLFITRILGLVALAIAICIFAVHMAARAVV